MEKVKSYISILAIILIIIQTQLKLEKFNIFSNDMREGERIPYKSTMDSYVSNSPHLGWTDVPLGAKILALYCYNPDTAMYRCKHHTHWLIYDIPISTNEIPQGEKLPTGVKEVMNDCYSTNFQEPSARESQRLFFVMYALSEIGLQNLTKLIFCKKLRFKK